MRVLLWHVHGSWTTAFLQGKHEYVVPVLPDRGADGRGRAQTWEWPENAVERSPEALRNEEIDLVILQRPHEIGLVQQWMGRTPGVDIPAIYLEHNAPEPHPVNSRHPLADRSDIPLVHVTHFNELCWDSGAAATTVIEHGVLDPGALYTGEMPRAAVVVNEPSRRGRMVGADLLPDFASTAPIDLFGMSDLSAELPGVHVRGDVPQSAMHAQLAQRRMYLHLVRWTSLGLSLVEAMTLGMPVVALACTEVVEAVPPGAGVISTDVATLHEAVRRFIDDPVAARAAGAAARSHALQRYGLSRFLADWDALLWQTAR